ncbi:MAG: DUF4352 domain-containing protein [Lachnospiraceae bacterium]|nr:DUF4352 domain-containing protein [Lachnospiraceae bacterium]
MSKKVYLTLLVILLCITMPGCGKSENPDISANPEASSNPSSGADNNNNNTTELPEISEPPEETESPETTKNPEPEQTPGKTKKPKTETVTLVPDQQYSDDNKAVKILGLKEYQKLESENYTDKAGKGKKFLVLFLSITNTASEEDYINYNYVSAKVDGKSIENTSIINEPKSYPTIFTHIPSGSTIGGFIVWKVPEDWKKMEFVYNGWKDRDNVSLKATFTPDDLSDPLIYNPNNL